MTTEASRALLIVDVGSGKTLGTIKTGADVSHMVVVAPSHRRAFVANIGSGSVTIIDLATNTRIRDLATGAGTEGIDISPDQSEVWVANRAADTVSVIDVGAMQVSASLACKGFPIRVKFTPDGRHVLISNARSGDVAVFDAATRKELRRVSMDANAGSPDSSDRMFGGQFAGSPAPVGILVSPALSHAFVASTNADIVSMIDLGTWKVVGRLTAGKEPDGLGYSPLTVRASSAAAH